MKAILISIKPKYVADILNGRKIIEIRKTTPKCDLPIDVYIYCTKSDIKGARENFTFEQLKLLGKVVAKFTLNKVEEIHSSSYGKIYYIDTSYERSETKVLGDSCLTFEELNDYLKYKIGYAWHISNLEIFDEPKELSEFYPYCKDEKCEYRNNHCSICYRTPLTKASQSFMFIESD